MTARAGGTLADPFLDLSFAPNLKLVPTVREFVTHFYDAILSDADGLSRLEVATHELLENAVKHSTDGATKIRIDYAPSTRKVTVRTLNRPTPEDLQILKKNIDEIRSTEDADAYYQLLLQRSAKLAEGSGLGLGRTWVEAGFTIHFEIDPAGVWVIAESTL